MAVDRGPFGPLLRHLREGASLSQEELAERAGLTAKAVGALERGERRRPYPTTVRALAEALELDDAGRAALADAARGQAPATGTTPAPVRSPSPEGAIPAPPTPTVGREDERRQVAALLRDGSARLVTLTGPGGVGKSRLAWEVATDLRREGIAVTPVELAPLRSSELVVPTIVRALGVRAGADDLLDRAAAVVAERAPVVVLDNVEHLLDAAPALADLLARCPDLRVLATSRAPLRIRAEREHPVAPLALPADDGVEAVLASPAGRLFVDRATAVAPDLEVDRDTAVAVATICRRLDGLPLALELVAAHARLVVPGQLLDRLDRALATGRVRDLPARQQTMAATLDWSLALCTTDEQRLLEAVSVFAGAFDPGATEAVAGGEVEDPLAAVDGLVEQSLVLRAEAGPGGEARHRLLEPVRAAAAGRLAPARADDLRRRHAEHLASVAAAARTGLRGTDQPRWLARLAVEHADVGAALGTLVAGGDHGRAATACGDIWLYWALRGHVAEGLRWVGRVTGGDDRRPLRPAEQVAALVASSGLRLATGDSATALGHADEAVALARGADGTRGRMGEALLLLASAALFEGALDRAAAAIDELERRAGDDGDHWARAHALVVGAQMAIVRGDPDGARGVLAEAEGLARSHAGPFTLAMVLNVGATLALIDADDDVVQERLTEAATIAAEVGTTWTLVYTLPALGGLAARRGDDELAVTFFAAGAAVIERSMVTVAFGPDAEAAASQLELARQRLEPEVVARAWAEGRDLELGAVARLVERVTALDGPT